MKSKSEYKTTLRLNLEKARDRKIYKIIADKKNINEYIKHCIEKESLSVDEDSSNIKQVIKDTVKEVLWQLEPDEEEEYEAESETFKEINAEEQEVKRSENEEIKDELSGAALNFLESLGSV